MVVGFLGGLTTFSAYSIEFVSLLTKGQAGVTLLHVLSHVVLSLLAVCLMYWVAQKGLVWIGA